MLSSLEAQVALVSWWLLSSWSWVVKTSVSIKQVSRRKQEMCGPTSYLIKPRALADVPPPSPQHTHTHILELVYFAGNLKVAVRARLSPLFFTFCSDFQASVWVRQADNRLLYHCCVLCRDVCAQLQSAVFHMIV